MLGRRLVRVALLAAAVALLAVPSVSVAAIITPNTTADQFNTDAANCSLREAVEAADDNSNANAPGCTAGDVAMDTIRLPAGRYELTIPQDDALAEDVASGDLQHNSALRVEAGPPATQPVTIDANQLDRIFQSFGSLQVDGITLTGGFVDTPGPDSATTGGAIAASTGNVLTMTDSAVVGNRSDGFGGGIAWPDDATLTNVTVSGNTVTENGGGGIEVGGAGSSLAMDHVTVTDNHAVTDGSMSGGEGGGGVLLFAGATASVHNSIIAGNTENRDPVNTPNCEGPFTSTGGNVIGTEGTCAFSEVVGQDEVNVADAGLAPLGDYGGPSLTHALLGTSTAIDQGVATCQVLDQRGFSRAGQGASCDAGAYERLTGDTDGDGVLDAAPDNCPNGVNARQENNDGDMQGDVCDADDDNDGVVDTTDNCDFQANADQADNDGDGIGNVCDLTPNPPALQPATPSQPLAATPTKKKCKKGFKLKKGKCKKKRKKRKP